jgi:hypothetical protein
LSKKFDKKIRQNNSSRKNCQKNSSKKFVKTICQKKGTPRKSKEPQGTNTKTVTPKLQRKMVPFSFAQSRFLEAPLVRQADGELKNTKIRLIFGTKMTMKINP